MKIDASAEFRVSANSTDTGFSVSVAGHADGSFLVSWVSLTEPFGEDGDSRNSYDVLARAYRNGNAVSSDFIVNTERRDGQFNPQAAARADGSYVVAYSSGEENHLEGTFAASQILSNSGSRIGQEQFGDYSNYHYNPDVSISTGGQYVVVSVEETSGEAQIHAADGSITNVYDFGFTDLTQVGATSLSSGDYMFLWHGYASEDGLYDSDEPVVSGLYAQRGDNSGTNGDPFLIAVTNSSNVEPTAKALGDGRALVVWSDSGQVQFTIVNPSSQSVTAPTVVGVDGGESQAEIAVLGNGDFVITWTSSHGSDGSGTAIEAQVFHADGSTSGDPFVVNAQTAGDQTAPSIAALGADGFVIGWQGPDGIKARTFHEAGDATTSPLFTRTGTVDLSPSANQSVAGTSSANSFFVDIAATSGQDRITSFGKSDVLLTTAALHDGNGDGLIGFGKNGILDLDGPGGGSDTIRFESGVALRAVGVSNGLFVYADARVRPSGAIEGTLASETLKGDLAGAKAETFFFDTALGAGFGNDRINSFGSSDILVTTTKISDANGDGLIKFGGDKILDVGQTHIDMHNTKGATITSLEFDGTVQHNGETYYVYSQVGSSGGTVNLHF